MEPDTKVFFAELQPDNLISKIIELDSSLSCDSNNRFDPLVGEERCCSLSCSTSLPRNVIYSVCKYKLYPESGYLVGGTIDLSWDSITSSWTDGTYHYEWDNENFEWIIK
jgi:hypothetical protein